MKASIEALGDCALLVSFGERLDIELNSRAVALAKALREANLPEVLDIAPAYASVCVRFRSASARERLAAAIAAAAENAAPAPLAAASCVEIPVCYGGAFGPDLGAVAAHGGIDEATAAELHAAGDYCVAMLGFAPGFPYLFGLDATLHTPRRASPRTRVQAGSVAVGGAQTGIYPRELPGGWNIVGRTPLTLFDAGRDPPALLAPGQRVRFRAIGADEFASLSR